MSRSPEVLADFLGTFSVEGRWGRQTVEGRVLLSRDQLVLAGTSERVRVPLSNVLDVGLGTVPDELARFFDDCVTVAFRTEDGPRVAVVEAERDLVDRFSTLLFKTQLNGTRARLNHPARVGGRLTSDRFVAATLHLVADGVAFTDVDTSFRIDLDAVIGFRERERTVDGGREQVISLRHVPNGRTMTTEIGVDSARRQNLLGRYLRLEYGDRLDAVRDVELSTGEKRLLMTLHAGGSVRTLPSVLDVDAGQVSMLLTRLEEQGLLATTDEETRLTPTGRILVGEYVQDVNE